MLSIRPSISKSLLLSLPLSLLLPLITITLLGLSENNATYDIALVLGNKVERDGTPSPRLAARLDRAHTLWQAKRCRHIIVSGGLGKEGFDEALVMKNYLTQKGIPPTAITTDSKGNNTWLSAVNARPHNTTSIVAISQFFHLPRCRLALHKNGFNTISTSYARHFELRDFYATLREIPALIKYAFK